MSNDGAFSQALVLVRSVFHGPVRSGLLQVAPLEGRPSALFGASRDDQGRAPKSASELYAMPVVNASSELQMLDNLAALKADEMPRKLRFGFENVACGD